MNPLRILAFLVILALSARGAEPGKRFVITEHGAVADGRTLNTEAIQRTIDSAAGAGGGTVVVPRGTFLSGGIFLKPAVHLHLDKDAVLKGSDDLSHYPIQDTRIEGQTNKWAVALVNATATDGLRISGEGVIDGNGLKFWEAFWTRRRENLKCTNLEVVRPRLLHIRDARDVRISGVKLRDSGFWTLHLFQCEQVLLENLRVTAPEEPVRAPSSDGIDLDSCRDVIVRGCFIAVGDDCLALKCGKGPRAHLDNRPVENVLVEGCEFGHGHGVLTIGSEATTVRNVTVRDCRVTGPNRLVRFKLRPDTQQLYEQITYENIRMEGGEVFDVRPWTQFFDPKGEKPPPSFVRNVRLRNITVTGAAAVGELRGNPGDTLENFQFENVAITAKKANWPTNSVKEFSLRNVTVNGQAITTPAPAPAPLPAPAQAGAIRHEEISVKAPFAMPPIQVPVFPKRDFPITDFGAEKGGKGDNTEAIRKAIAACHGAGGGRVVVPPGEWRTGKIHFRSNVNLHLEKDATLVFSGKPEDYLPAVQSSWEGHECFNYSPLIYAFDCENVAVTGAGKLEAEMGTWKTWFARPPAHLEALKKLYAMASTNVPVEQRQMAEGENHLRPQFLQFNRCRNVLLEGVSIRHSPFWTIHLLLCDSVVVRGLDVYAHGHNNDGIDPEMTRNLLVENCRFDQGDDAIALKAGSNQDGWRLGIATENIVMRNCTVVAGHQLVAIGSELSAGIRNVYVHDCRFVDDQYRPFNLLFIKTNLRRGGFVENIHLENIEARGAKQSVLGIETDVLYQWKTLVRTYEERITKISGIHVRNVKVGETGTPFRILGDKREPVRDVTLDNITIGKVRGEKSHYENVEHVRETNIHLGEILPGNKTAPAKKLR